MFKLHVVAKVIIAFSSVGQASLADEPKKAVCGPSAGEASEHVLLLQDRLSVEQRPSVATDLLHPEGPSPKEHIIWQMLKSAREKLRLSPQPSPQDLGNSGGNAGPLLMLEKELDELDQEVAAQKQLLLAQRQTPEAASTVSTVSTVSTASWGLDCAMVIVISAILLFSILVYMLSDDAGGRMPGSARRIKQPTTITEHVGAGFCFMFILLFAEIYTFTKLGLLQPSMDAISPYVVVIIVSLSCLVPVIGVVFLRIFYHFAMAHEEANDINERFDKLEEMVYAGFGSALKEEQTVLERLRGRVAC